MSLIQLNDVIFVDPLEVCSIQEEETWSNHDLGPSGSDMRCDFKGACLTLKNGRKIYVADLNAKQVADKLQTPLVQPSDKE